jgi:hypothetical protein
VTHLALLLILNSQFGGYDILLWQHAHTAIGEMAVYFSVALTCHDSPVDWD